ncbi:hypothetical protein BGZ60DRAFT_431293 [Tricladium varicosporioides]|nr:hypothetical protein BGZ60DRAFT_431293 [Hymenoscyphus varicosporioides]
MGDRGKEEEISMSTSSITSGDSIKEENGRVFCCANQAIPYLRPPTSKPSASTSQGGYPTSNSTTFALFISALRSLHRSGDPGLMITPIFPTQALHQFIILQHQYSSPEQDTTAKCLIQIQTVHPTSAFYGIGKEYRFHYFLPVSEGNISTYHQRFPEEAFISISEQRAQLFINASGNPWVLEEKPSSDTEEVSWVCGGCEWSYWVRVLDVSPLTEGLARGPQGDTVVYSSEHGQLDGSCALGRIGELAEELKEENIPADMVEGFDHDEYVEVGKEIERDLDRDTGKRLESMMLLDTHEAKEGKLGCVVGKGQREIL